MAGFSENGGIDPLYPSLRQHRAVFWRGGRITDLGTLAGGYQSAANAVNSSGQVVGASLTAVPDSYSMQLGIFNPWARIGGIQPPYRYQTRAFVWNKEDGMLDLGTLGGADAQALVINERGQILGHSYIGSTPSPSCNYPLATDSFLWDNENGMVDLGTLGGTCTLGFDLNQKGQVVGVSNLEGDQVSHAFLWSNGVMSDLGGSLGGSLTGTSALNERGEAAGFATLSDNQTFHAVLWRRVGQMTDLGVLGKDQCSYATGINTREEVVGTSISVCNSDEANFRAFLWQHGSMTDLNALIPFGSSLHLQVVETINDRGEIAGTGVDASGNAHAFLLVPCVNDSPKGCDTVAPGAIAPAKAIAAERPLNPTHTSIRRMPSAQWENPLDRSARNSGPSLHGPSSGLMVVSSVPPKGTVGMKYGRTTTERCYASPFLGWHQTCFPCSSYSACASLPPCAGLFPSPCRRTIFLAFTFHASGGVLPYTWSASGMPPGLNVNPRSGQIHGTPRTGGSYYVTIGVTDSKSPPSHASAHYTIRIVP